MPGGRRQSSSSRHAPPLPFDRSSNEPVRVYPPESSRSSTVVALQALHSKSVAVVGLLSSSSSSCSQAFAFANRLIGRCVFRDDEMQSAMTVKDSRLPASIHLFYDDEARCIFLLGVARPDSLCFSADNGAKTTKGRTSTRREDAEPMALTEAQRLREEMDNFEHEKLKMQALLYTSCNMVFVLCEDARVTTTVLKEVRALAVEKTQLVSSAMSAVKHSKRDGGHSKGSSLLASSAFAPGRCVPLVMYVVPAPDELWDVTLKTQGSTGQTRSATVAYCKALEARLTALFRSLRGSTVGSVRMRDVLSAANLGKERRVFNMDPAHSVVVVSRRTATTDGRAEAQLEDLMYALDTEISADEILADDSLLQPLEDDDNGFQRIHQYLHKYLNLLFSTGSGSSNKDGGRTELLTPSQWLKGFHALAKLNRQ